MELRHIYILSDCINDKIKDRTFPSNIKNDMEISISVSQPTFYGIDKQLYYMTHDNSYEGFEHTNTYITACIDGIKFKIFPKQKTTD